MSKETHSLVFVVYCSGDIFILKVYIRVLIDERKTWDWVSMHAATQYTHTTSHIGITFDLFFPSSYKRSIQSLISDRLIRRSYTGELNELINYF